MFTKWLQDAFDVPLVIQITDDEKFLWKDMDVEEAQRLGYENTRGIIACGFDPKKTFIFSDLDYMGHMYPIVVQIQKKITYSQARNCFGFQFSDNIGKQAFPAVQAAPSFSAAFPTVLRGMKNAACLIPCAIDQDPYFRMTRDIAPRLGWEKPGLLHSKFVPSLQGARTKMSASDKASSIYLTDDPATILDKINKYAFSGGGDTAEEQREKGANLEEDMPYQWLNIFLDDDERLAQIREEYGSGRMLTGEVKKELADVLTKIALNHQEQVRLATDAVVDSFMRVRPLRF